jgi:hypothetical protein
MQSTTMVHWVLPHNLEVTDMGSILSLDLNPLLLFIRYVTLGKLITIDWAAIAEYHRLGGLNNGWLLLYSCGAESPWSGG